MITNIYDHTHFTMDIIPGASRNKICPYCRHAMPGCDCGYDLMLLESNQPAPRKGLKALLLSLLGING